MKSRKIFFFVYFLVIRPSSLLSFSLYGFIWCALSPYTFRFYCMHIFFGSTTTWWKGHMQRVHSKRPWVAHEVCWSWYPFERQDTFSCLHHTVGCTERSTFDPACNQKCWGTSKLSFTTSLLFSFCNTFTSYCVVIVQVSNHSLLCSLSSKVLSQCA